MQHCGPSGRTKYGSLSRSENTLATASYPAIYRDDYGEEAVILHRERAGFHTTVRGVDFDSSYDLCLLEAQLDADSSQLATFTLNATKELRAYTLTFQMPVFVVSDNVDSETVLDFCLQHGEATAISGSLRVTLIWNGLMLTSQGKTDWAEAELNQIQSQLPAGAYLKCCLNCAYSDYNPVGGPLACFRDNREAYSQVKSKSDIFRIWHTLTEEVYEAHMCNTFRRRIPGTGYRG